MPAYKKRQRGLFDPNSSEPFKISRSKIDLFVDCPRCFYLDLRYGIPRPSFPAFTLNNAVDTLLKKEFDVHREAQSVHPLCKEHGIDAVPYQHEELEAWRDALRRGIQYHHKPTNFLVRGGIDDVWIDKEGKLIIVDYKATSKIEKPNLDGFWQQAYKRQAEVYQWLFRQNGFDVHPTAYFVYVNGKADLDVFDAKLEFDMDIIPYEGSDDWIEGTLIEARGTLERNAIPEIGENCEYCTYREAAGKKLQEIVKGK
ncbi:MAG: PD-(D/E)XK nuclease family protein [Candidatus Paceibacterota bacterium]